MLLDERYLTLYERFGGESAPVEVTLEELSELLYCTPRNAKLILKKLQSEQLIDWLPGLGRGHRSRIVFHTDKEPYLLEYATQTAVQGDYKRAFDLIAQYGDGTNAKAKFLEWLDNQFGYKKEEAGEGEQCRDSLTFPILKAPLTIDPADLLYSFDSHLIRQIFDRLLRFDEKQGKIVPMLAHYWCSNFNSTEWTFYLRKGVRFHNGQELTSRDVQFTLERLWKGTANSWLLREVKSIETIGPRVLRIKLNRVNRIFDRFMCSAAASILPFRFVGMEEEAFWKQPIGTGPFQLTKWMNGRIRLDANENYFEGRPYLDEVEVVIMPEDCSQDMDFLAKVHHSLDTMRMDQRATREEWQELEKLCQGCVLLNWNVAAEGPQQSEAFRQAVRQILHPGDMIAELGGERAIPAFGFRPEASSPHVPEPIKPEQIRSLLVESGYGGEIMRFAFHPKYHEDGIWIMNRLAEWGIHTEMLPYDCLMQVDFCISGLVFPEDEVCEIEAYEHRDCVMQNFFDTEWKTWIISRIDAAVAADSTEERRALLKEIEETLRQEALIIFLQHRRLSTYLHPSVRGVSLNPLGWIDFKDVWLEEHD
ncbi:DNA-binding transcriptional regulator SgrR of sgrS sRNA, contains a MarR-type HTH domain and a solute-binding domain [Paenibacillus catalpae]|uniref:DNA-binding transcriptional regulator SgrR of sgrS sRNA, contains a MarR-type HTH domain and a solute-binding domain n=1 Tax=Paenibacillus catalpae TaxID=1045775 RepID=A0A1I2C423_9BACL|nr:SgrR family transcriptional regulator [Paenibacillus catalpae]SFE63121.1 DNA-binding transcriptional regulator SgrR of sgrS sRNA, contains a MarR-type HTH domain and a solute-binding domain [Paenibacillus catalpae]